MHSKGRSSKEHHVKCGCEEEKAHLILKFYIKIWTLLNLNWHGNNFKTVWIIFKTLDIIFFDKCLLFTHLWNQEYLQYSCSERHLLTRNGILRRTYEYSFNSLCIRSLSGRVSPSVRPTPGAPDCERPCDIICVTEKAPTLSPLVQVLGSQTKDGITLKNSFGCSNPYNCFK